MEKVEGLPFSPDGGSGGADSEKKIICVDICRQFRFNLRGKKWAGDFRLLLGKLDGPLDDS